MYKIEKITNYPRQSMTVVISDGSSFFMEIYFIPMQQGWFITQLTYGDFEIKGLRITNNVNMLRNFRNKIPFGLACYSTANREPSLEDDFLSESSILYVLTEAEVLEVEDYLNG